MIYFSREARAVRQDQSRLREFRVRAKEEMKKARAENKTGQELQELHGLHGCDFRELDDELELSLNAYWMRRLTDYGLEIPWTEEFRTENGMTSERVLNMNGRQRARELVREEVQFRRERLSLLLSILATVVSFMALYASWRTA